MTTINADVIRADIAPLKLAVLLERLGILPENETDGYPENEDA